MCSKFYIKFFYDNIHHQLSFIYFSFLSLSDIFCVLIFAPLKMQIFFCSCVLRKQNFTSQVRALRLKIFYFIHPIFFTERRLIYEHSYRIKAAMGKQNGLPDGLPRHVHRHG